MAQTNLVAIHNAGGYGSEFDYDSELEARRSKRKDLAVPKPVNKLKIPSSREVTQEYTKEEARTHRFHFLSLDAYSRHKKLINDYMLYYGGSHGALQRDTSRDKTDMDIIQENHQFVWDEDTEDTWEKRLAKKYYDKLFKEYCICDLSKYKENKVAMRWRVEKEVLSGKGQFSCGERKCKEAEGLRSWEVNFGYTEHAEKKNALVKLRLCPDCSYKLNYHRKKREVTGKRKSGSSKLKPIKKQKTGEHSEETDQPTSEQTEGGENKSRTEAPPGEGTSSQTADGASNIWSGPAKIVDEKSREEEFDDYFEDMFL